MTDEIVEEIRHGVNKILNKIKKRVFKLLHCLYLKNPLYLNRKATAQKVISNDYQRFLVCVVIILSSRPFESLRDRPTMTYLFLLFFFTIIQARCWTGAENQKIS